MKRCVRVAAVGLALAAALPCSCFGTPDGYFDTTWAGGGKIAFHSWVFGNADPCYAERILVESNGNLLVSGYGDVVANNYYWLGELSPDGQFVPTFGVSNGSGLTTSVDLGVSSGYDIRPIGVAT